MACYEECEPVCDQTMTVARRCHLDQLSRIEFVVPGVAVIVMGQRPQVIDCIKLVLNCHRADSRSACCRKCNTDALDPLLTDESSMKLRSISPVRIILKVLRRLSG